MHIGKVEFVSGKIGRKRRGVDSGTLPSADFRLGKQEAWATAYIQPSAWH